jgi:hypothetical protein
VFSLLLLFRFDGEKELIGDLMGDDASEDDVKREGDPEAVLLRSSFAPRDKSGNLSTPIRPSVNR